MGKARQEILKQSSSTELDEARSVEQAAAPSEPPAGKEKPKDSILLRHKRDLYYLVISAFVVVYLQPLTEARAVSTDPHRLHRSHYLHRSQWCSPMRLWHRTENSKD
eukprot:SAG11_NODE_6936_length_1222_cov_2.739982_1_plen_107_part_00